jgi:perosamine synthetase
MFTQVKTYGKHTVFNYDTSKHNFIDFFKNLYNTEQLDKLGLYEYTNEGISDIETELHKKFYTNIKSDNTFKKLYCNLIRDIHLHFFPNESTLIYQSFPSIRLQFKNNVAVPPHYDSDHTGCHPIGERNFLLPITDMFGSIRLFIESEPRKADFQGIDMKYGNILYFDGNQCTHYNEKNIENCIRISLDFRVITLNDYKHYIQSGNITTTNPRDPDKIRKPVKMIIGGYYQLTNISDTLEQMLDWHFQKDMILQTRPSFDENEANACYEYMKSGENFITEYFKTTEFEKMLCEKIGVKHCVMTTSGNMAIILGLMACGIHEGDDVIVPNYTMIATINSIKFIGANPIIVDIDKDTLTLSRNIILSALTPKTKAIVHVSLNNRHNNIEDIVSLCNDNNILLIEDAAQSLGCHVKGQHFGTFGKIGCFSLSTPKIITTGQGGFVVTNDDEIATKMRMIKNFGRKSGGIDIFETFGINMKFTDIQAVIGIEQLKKIDYRVQQMRHIYNEYYRQLLHVCKMIKPNDDDWFPWFVDIFVNDRDKLALFLKNHNIQTRNTYPEINKTPMYYSDDTFPNSEWVSNTGLFLPSHLLLTDREIKYICDIIRVYYSI